MNEHDCDTTLTAQGTLKAGLGKVAILMIVVIVAFYILREHWDHVLGSWAYLILLLCPAMHLFKGHGHHPHSSRKE